jgi:FecR-like protein
MRRISAAVTSSILVAFVLSISLTSPAQTRDRFVISARAGGVNVVTGRASMHPRGNSEWQQLTIKEDLETGDVVRTGLDGRVEMLLNPGSYLRVGENSEFELADNSLENLEVRLIRGTVIVEATGADNTELLINITTPHTKFAIVRRGLYRLNVTPGDGTELIVRKGRVMLDDSHTKVKGGNKVVFSSGSFSIAKLEQIDKKNLDNLESWSKQRAETVAQANRKLTRRDMSLLMAMNPLWDYHFSPARSGIWMFNSGYGCYTFMPFYLGWGSPYGSSYSSSFFRGYYDPSFYYGSGRVGSYPQGSSSVPTGSSNASSPSMNPAPPLSSPQSAPTQSSEPRVWRSPVGGQRYPVEP